jgi:hypothetical protein
MRQVKEIVDQVRHIQGVGDKPVEITFLFLSVQALVAYHEVYVAPHRSKRGVDLAGNGGHEIF